MRFHLGLVALLPLSIAACQPTSEQAAPVLEGRALQEAEMEANHSRPEESNPLVTGKWEGTWKSSKSGHGGGLQCTAVETGKDMWKATFVAQYGQEATYSIEMIGQREGPTVLFEGDVDLGEKDGGVYHWTGRATANEFVGEYSSSNDSGGFRMQRPR